MADRHGDYEDYRRGGRREWNERRSDERPNWSEERWFGDQPRRWRSQGDGDSYTDDGYTFAPGEPRGYGRGSEFAGGRGSFEAGGYGRERSGDRGYGNEPGYSGERGFGSERGGYPGDRSFFGPRRQGFGESFGGQRPHTPAICIPIPPPAATRPTGRAATPAAAR